MLGIRFIKFQPTTYGCNTETDSTGGPLDSYKRQRTSARNLLAGKSLPKVAMVQKPRVLVNTRLAEASPNISRYVG